MGEVDRVPAQGGGPRRLRILWVVSRLDLEGAITGAAAGAARALAARGHDAHLAGPAEADPEPPPGVTLHRWRPGGKLARLGHVLALQRRIGADVLHFHSALPHGDVLLGVRALGRWLGRPRIFVTAHSSRPFPKRRARLGLRVADVIVPPSDWSARTALAAGATEAATHVVPNGLDPLAREVDDGAREPLVVALGRLVAIKNFDLLIDAFDRAAATRPGWRLVIGGEGSGGDALRARQRAASAADRIELPGWVGGEAKSSLLARASIGVVPSRRESFGLALLEFQQHGLACIASDVGALPEHARGGRAARLVPPGDIDALAATLGDLMDAPGERAGLALEGRRVADALAWPALAEQLESLYRKSLAARA